MPVVNIGLFGPWGRYGCPIYDYETSSDPELVAIAAL